MPDAVYKQVLDDVKADIVALALSELDTEMICVRKTPWDDDMIYSGVSISWDTSQVSRRNDRATNLRDMIGYPVFVTIVEGTGKGIDDQMTRILDRRQRIFRTFNNQRLDGVTATNTSHVVCKVVDGHPGVPKQYRDNYDVTQLVIWCWFIEPRENEA